MVCFDSKRSSPVHGSISVLQLLLLAISLSGCATTPSSVLKNPAVDERAATAVDDYLRAEVGAGFSGVVLIARGDDILLHEAYSSDPAVTTDSAFWIGSTTKPIAAVAVMKLQEQGKLSVSDPIAKYLPGVPVNKRHISIHHLLTHTSGLGHEYTADGIVDRDEAIEAILALPITEEPGSFSYSNDGYNLLAAIISIASGMSYEAWLQQEVFGPANIRHAGFWGMGGENSEAPIAPITSPRSADVSVPNWGYRGATGISARADDLFHLRRALQEHALLNEFSTQTMFAPHVPRSDKNAYGYGWSVDKTIRGTRLISHNGAEDGIDHYSSLRIYTDENLVVVLVSNAPEETTWDTLSGTLSTFFGALSAGNQ